MINGAYLLDTNVVSELRKLRPHGGLVAWLRSIDDAQLYLCAVTLGEIQAGIELMREQCTVSVPQDAMKSAVLRGAARINRNSLARYCSR